MREQTVHLALVDALMHPVSRTVASLGSNDRPLQCELINIGGYTDTFNTHRTLLHFRV